MNTDIVKLEARNREEGKNPRQMRASGQLPVTIYGKNTNLNLAINTRQFNLAYQKDKSSQFEFSFEGKKYLTSAKSIQKNYATGEILSAEFVLAQ